MQKLKVSYGDQSAQLKPFAPPTHLGKGSPRLNRPAADPSHASIPRSLFTSGVLATEREGPRGFGYPRFKHYQRSTKYCSSPGRRQGEPAMVGRWSHASSRRSAESKSAASTDDWSDEDAAAQAGHRRWYVIVVTDIEAVPLPATGRSVGRLGVARFLTTSDGQIIANRGSSTRSGANRTPATPARPRRTGSGNTPTAAAGPRKRVAQTPQPAARLPPPDAWPLTNRDAIALEGPPVAAMTATAAGTVEHPGRNVAGQGRAEQVDPGRRLGAVHEHHCRQGESAGRRVRARATLLLPRSTACLRGPRTRPSRDTSYAVHGALDAD